MRHDTPSVFVLVCKNIYEWSRGALDEYTHVEMYVHG